VRYREGSMEGRCIIRDETARAAAEGCRLSHMVSRDLFTWPESVTQVFNDLESASSE